MLQTNEIFTRFPKAFAYRVKVRPEGSFPRIRLLSSRATADCVVPMRAATSACVRPADARAAMILSSSESSALACLHSFRKFGSSRDSFNMSRQVLVAFMKMLDQLVGWSVVAASRSCVSRTDCSRRGRGFGFAGHLSAMNLRGIGCLNHSENAIFIFAPVRLKLCSPEALRLWRCRLHGLVRRSAGSIGDAPRGRHRRRPVGKNPSL